MQGVKPYSEDLGRRIVRVIQARVYKSEAACLLGASFSSVTRYTRTASQGEGFEPRKSGERPPKTDGTTKKLLEEDVKECPAATVFESVAS